MNGYYDIHCPYCGSVTSPLNVKFSLTEFVEEIFNQRLDDKYNDGILGEIDIDEINLILDNDYLWDMSAADIQQCYVGEMFVLSGENLIRRFGINAVAMLNAISKDTLITVAQSNNISEAFEQYPDVKKLVEEILNNISRERIMRTEVSVDDRNAAVLNLLQYAKSQKVLFKVYLKIEIDRDDIGNIINKDIRTEDERIICKSKRCPGCGNELSKMAGKYEEKIISFIGSPAAGKSAYLAAAINKLLTTGQSEYGIEVIFDYQSSDYIAFNDACLYPYSKGFAITKTNKGTFPQLSIALKNTRLSKTYLYTFVDIPGETFIDENGCNVSDILANRRIIKYADVIWYCVSSKQFFSDNIGRIRRSQTDGIENEEMKDLKILGQNTIKFSSELFDGTEKKPAVAIILTKSDLLGNYIMDLSFNGDPAKNTLIKREYFKTICAVPQSSYYDDNDQYDSYDGEPNTLGYMYDGKLIYQKCINASNNVRDFITKYGDSYAEVFIGNVATAFQKNTCPCFSQASYGRIVDKYSLEVAVKHLLKNKNRLMARDYDDLIDIFGEKELELFENGEGKLPIIKDKNDITYIQNLYKKINPIFPFGIMSILEWTFAYTGFVECVEYSGEKWNTVPVSGPMFETLKEKLTLNADSSNIISESFVRDVNNDDKKKKKRFLFG